LTANNSILHIPSHTVSNSRKVWAVIKEFEEEFGVEPTVEDISDIMNISVDQVKQAMQASKANYTSSIDKPIGNDEGGRTLAEILPDEAQSPDSILDSKILRGVIVEALSLLSKREEMVLRLRFGITEVDENQINQNQ
jgi:RNA polymerase primary sigma factor